MIPHEKFHPQSSSGREASTYTRKGASGKDVTYHSCAICGTKVWICTANMSDVRIVQKGTLDDEQALHATRLGVEVWICERVKWVGEFEGAEQTERAPR